MNSFFGIFHIFGRLVTELMNSVYFFWPAEFTGGRPGDHWPDLLHERKER